MKRILILVEGATEERFVKEVLNPLFIPQNITLIPTIVNTKIVKSEGKIYKGGWVSYAGAKRDLKNLLNDSDATIVTTMFDFYGLPKDFPQWECNGTCYEQVTVAEQVFSNDINHPKFIPYIQLHEFEGLLFSSPQAVSDTLVSPRFPILTKVQEIRNSVGSPEEINKGHETHPSMRLLKLFPAYNKPVYGSLIALRTGLDSIRKDCPHFNDWILKLLK